MSGDTGATNAVVPDVAMPARLNTQRAFDMYVFGRSRKLGPLEKDASAVTASRPPAGGADGDGPVVDGARPGSVAVPRALRFDRNAGTWRSS